MNTTSNSQSLPHFNTSAVRRIRLSKMASLPATTLKLYRVDFSTAALVQALKSNNQIDLATRLKDERSIWIPAPILQIALPEMVGTYERCRKRKNVVGNAMTPPPVRFPISQLHVSSSLGTGLQHPAPITSSRPPTDKSRI
jgi:hypothetical protein